MSSLLSSKANILNAVSSVIETFAAPLMLLVVTPLLLRYLGADDFGRLSFITAISGLGLIANAGMGAAALHFIAQYTELGSHDEARRVFQTALCLCLLCLLLVSGLILVAGGLATMFSDAFEAGLSRYGPQLVLTAFLYLILQQLDWYYSWSLKALQGFGSVALIELSTRALTYVAALVAVRIVPSVLLVGLIYAMGLAISIAAKQRVIVTRFGAHASALQLHRAHLKEIFNYSRWTWLHSLSAALFGYADRLLVAVFLLPTQLAYYSICLQLGQIVHALPAAGFQFLFPLLSRASAKGGHNTQWRQTRDAVLLNWALSLTLTGVLLVFVDDILERWISAAFAAENTGLAVLVVIAFSLNSLHVASYYMLLGWGRVKYVSLLMLFSASTAVMTMPFMLKAFELPGVAYARILYSLFLLHYVWVALHEARRPRGDRAEVVS